MTHSLLITKYILKILDTSDELKELIPISSFYPIDARLSSSFPFAVIQRTSLLPSRSKDGQGKDVVSFSVIVVDDNYIGAVTIADKVREVLDGSGWRDSDNNVLVSDISLTSANETIYNDTFLQQLDFTADFEYIEK